MSIEANKILSEGLELKDELVDIRRHIHANPEVGMKLPKTASFVKNKLEDLGLTVTEPIENGLLTVIRGEKAKDSSPTILLRADMDALAVKEKTELTFKSTNGCMHACGHDMHTTMLLGACELLTKHRADLKGNVKVIFQPDEEGFTGAKKMLAAGVLETKPVPDSAIALHVHSGTPTGLFICNKGHAMAGCTLFRVSVKGVSCHGAMPETGIDPIYVLNSIYMSIQELITREVRAQSPLVITIGKISGGSAPNIIPAEAYMEGTIRSLDKDLSALALKRIGEISRDTAKALRAKAKVTEISSAPPLINDPKLTDEMAGYVRELFGEKQAFTMEEGGMGSEDFASYTYLIPSAYLLIGAGSPAENPLYGKPMHNEKVVFNEDILPMGASALCYMALKHLS